MSKTVITGVGIVCALGSDTQAVLENLKGQEPARQLEQKVPFICGLPASKLRRISRYSKLALCAAMQAMGDTAESCDPFRVGTVFSTGYGAMENNLDFCRSVAEGNPDMCSPAVFAGTVPNSCVGQVCMLMKLKGASTVLIGSNPVEYVDILLKTGKADCIATGAVEEYNQELFDSLKKNEAAAGVPLAEGAAMLCVTDGEHAKDAICCAERFSCAALEGFPLTASFDRKKALTAVTAALKEVVGDGAMPDMILDSTNGCWFDEIEREAVTQVFGAQQITISPKLLVGETLGCSLMLNTVIGALCIREGSIFSALKPDSTGDYPVKRILVTGYDVAGNYCCTMLAE